MGEVKTERNVKNLISKPKIIDFEAGQIFDRKKIFRLNKVSIFELNFGHKPRKRYGTEQKFVEWLEYIYSRDKIIVTLIWLSVISP